MKRCVLIMFTTYLVALMVLGADAVPASGKRHADADTDIDAGASTATDTDADTDADAVIGMRTRSSPLKSMTYPKKVVSLKKRPTKLPATADVKGKKTDVADAFKDLPEDDLEFIKELDKQFKLHGSKIKIKVERDNSTADSKNAKRTIDGELGYGYNHNGYDYSKPKFMFYPYSQRDIPADAPAYYPKYETSAVTIEPSYSYELQPQTYEVPNEAPQIDLPHSSHQASQEQHHPSQAQQYDEPVIVLRIPGPQKYAAHLQTLLQQYLEIRAAQYLRILEEAELQKQPHHHQQYQQYEQQQPQSHLQPQPEPEPEAQPQPQQAPQPDHYQSPVEPHYYSDVVYGHRMPAVAQPAAYPNIAEVYQSYKGRHQHRPQAQAQHIEQPQTDPYGGHQDQAQPHSHSHSHSHPQPQPQQEPEGYQYYPQQHQHQHQHQVEEERAQDVGYYPQGPEIYPAQEVAQFFYTQEQQYSPPVSQPQPGHAYQQYYIMAMPTGGEDVHSQRSQPIYVPDEDSGHQTALATNENSPRKTHTKVIFTQNSEQGANDYSSMYPLPSIRPYERHAPTSMPEFHQNYQQQEVHATAASMPADQINYDYQPQPQQHTGAPQLAPSGPQNTVAITQRPFNYHAHALRQRKGRTRGRKRGVSAATLSKQAQETDDQKLLKIREYVRDNLGAQTGRSVEVKTTHIISG